MSLNESILEDAALGWFGEMGYAIGHGSHIAPSELVAERAGGGDIVVVGQLKPGLPVPATLCGTLPPIRKITTSIPEPTQFV